LCFADIPADIARTLAVADGARSSHPSLLVV
jgi:hypothetical protein